MNAQSGRHFSNYSIGSLSIGAREDKRGGPRENIILRKILGIVRRDAPPRGKRRARAGFFSGIFKLGKYGWR